MNPGLLSVDDALAQLLARAQPVGEIEEISTIEAAGRVLAKSQASTMDVPPMDNSAMDGYAIRLSNFSLHEKLRISQRIPAGSVGKPLAAGTAARIFTGAPVPPGTDAVVMVGIFAMCAALASVMTLLRSSVYSISRTS